MKRALKIKRWPKTWHQLLLILYRICVWFIIWHLFILFLLPFILSYNEKSIVPMIDNRIIKMGNVVYNALLHLFKVSMDANEKKKIRETKSFKVPDKHITIIYQWVLCGRQTTSIFYRGLLMVVVFLLLMAHGLITIQIFRWSMYLCWMGMHMWELWIWQMKNYNDTTNGQIKVFKKKYWNTANAQKENRRLKDKVRHSVFVWTYV